MQKTVLKITICSNSSSKSSHDFLVTMLKRKLFGKTIADPRYFGKYASVSNIIAPKKNEKV